MFKLNLSCIKLCKFLLNNKLNGMKKKNNPTNFIIIVHIVLSEPLTTHILSEESSHVAVKITFLHGTCRTRVPQIHGEHGTLQRGVQWIHRDHGI